MTTKHPKSAKMDEKYTKMHTMSENTQKLPQNKQITITAKNLKNQCPTTLSLYNAG